GVDEGLLGDAREALGAVQREIDQDQLTVECRRVQEMSVARALHEVAETEQASLLVVGSTRSDSPRLPKLGSTAERLAHGAPCPIAVVPNGWRARGELDTVGAAFVDTEEGREALRAAHAIAMRAGAKLRVLTVLRPTFAVYEETEPSVPPRSAKDAAHVEGEFRVAAEQAARRAVQETLGEVGADIEVEAFVGDPVETLVRVSENLDVLVCGSRGYGPLRAVLLGSVSRRIAAEARCPVILLPRGVRAALEELAGRVGDRVATAS
ncbi:MAG: hypothetical protein QOI98_2469, partial [Solirubrobacteraceae bacterium]|nr:hypothetical protein [Solirubrobacteraceae bacterium]